MQAKYKGLLLKIMATGYWYWFDFYIYPVVIVTLLTLAIWKLQISILPAILLVIAGYYSWGLFEYFMHRYVFHHTPLFRTGHEEHHARPRINLGTPGWITLTAYFLIAWSISGVIGYANTACLLAGFISGYYIYFSCHHIVHKWHIKPNTFLHRYKRFHDIHHYKKNVNFGVSWHIWDKVFRTADKSLHN